MQQSNIFFKCLCSFIFIVTTFVGAQETLNVKYYSSLPKRRPDQKNLSIYTKQVRRWFEILGYRSHGTLKKDVEKLRYLYGVRDSTTNKQHIGKKFKHKSEKEVIDLLDKWHIDAPKTMLPVEFDYGVPRNICIMGGVPGTLQRSLEGLQAYIRECKKKNINWEEKAQKIFVLIDSKRPTKEIIEETKNKNKLFASIASKCIIVDNIHAPDAALFTEFFRKLKDEHAVCLKNMIFIGTPATTHRARLVAKNIFADGAVENLAVIRGEFNSWRKKFQAYGYDKKESRGYHIFLTYSVVHDLIRPLHKKCT